MLVDADHAEAVESARIIDQRPASFGLLDMIEGRSTQVFKTWLTARDQAWNDIVEVVNGLSGVKTSTAEELSEAVTVMHPFHVVRVAAGCAGSLSAPRSTAAARSPRPQVTTRCIGADARYIPAPICSPPSS